MYFAKSYPHLTFSLGFSKDLCAAHYRAPRAMGDGLAIGSEARRFVGSTLYKCAKKFRNATEEFDAIANQVGATQLALRSVHDLLNDPATQALHSQKLYDDTRNVSEGCRDLFQKLKTLVKTNDTASF